MSLLLSRASEVGIWAPTQTNGIGAVWIRQILQLNLGSVIMVWLVHNWSGNIRSEQPLYNSLWYVQTDIWKCQLWQRYEDLVSKFQSSLIKQHWKLISGKCSKPLIPVQCKWKWFRVYYYPCGHRKILTWAWSQYQESLKNFLSPC